MKRKDDGSFLWQDVRRQKGRQWKEKHDIKEKNGEEDTKFTRQCR